MTCATFGVGVILLEDVRFLVLNLLRGIRALVSYSFSGFGIWRGVCASTVFCSLLASISGSALAQGNPPENTAPAPSVGNTIGATPFQECSKNYLQLRLDDRIGTLIMRGEDRARRFRLMLGNPTNDCTAIVKTISVEVVDTVEDHHGALEALMSSFRYRATISPSDKGKALALNGEDRFTYPPHSNPDQFVLDISSAKRGYSYALRFLVDWSDLRTKTSNRAQSWVAIASFPDAPGMIFGGDADTFGWRREQLRKWRQQYDGSKEALKDADVEDPPFKIERSRQ
jgi:hypothetical protein